jgi:hypothetical protein
VTDASVANLTDATGASVTPPRATCLAQPKSQRSNSLASDASDASRARVCCTNRRGEERSAPRSNATDVSAGRSTDAAQRLMLARSPGHRTLRDRCTHPMLHPTQDSAALLGLGDRHPGQRLSPPRPASIACFSARNTPTTLPLLPTFGAIENKRFISSKTPEFCLASSAGGREDPKPLSTPQTSSPS